MKKSGFTLAELLGVIIIISALMFVVLVPITNSINNMNKKMYESNKKIVVEATRKFVEENKEDFKPNKGVVYTLYLEQLIEEGYLDSKILDNLYKTNTDIDGAIGLTSYENENLTNIYVVNIEGNGKDFKYNVLSTFDSMNYFKNNYSTINHDGKKLLLKNKYNVDNTIYFSGIFWEPYGVNKDGSLRLITRDVITALIPNEGNQTYEDSYVREWLNNEFYQKLKTKNLIVDTEFCMDETDNSASTILECENKIKDKVGLLSVFEINSGMDKDIVANGSNFILHNTTNINKFYTFDSDKIIRTGNRDIPLFIRPVISISKNSKLLRYLKDGEESYLYVQIEDSEQNTATNNIVLQPGRYVKFQDSTEVYRIIDSTNKYIKLLSTSASTHSSYSNGTEKINLNNGVGYKLNMELFPTLDLKPEIKEKVINNMQYLSDISLDYKINSKDTYLLENAYLLPPKLGDMFIVSNLPTMTSTEKSTTQTYMIYPNLVNTFTKSLTGNVNYVMYVKNDFIIKSGKGRYKTEPYILDVK